MCWGARREAGVHQGPGEAIASQQGRLRACALDSTCTTTDMLTGCERRRARAAGSGLALLTAVSCAIKLGRCPGALLSSSTTRCWPIGAPWGAPWCIERSMPVAKETLSTAHWTTLSALLRIATRAIRCAAPDQVATPCQACSSRQTPTTFTPCQSWRGAAPLWQLQDCAWEHLSCW